jgi:hypothetical protein
MFPVDTWYLCTDCICRLRSLGVANLALHVFTVHWQGRVCVFMCLFSSPRLEKFFEQCSHCGEDTLSAVGGDLSRSDRVEAKLESKTWSSSSTCLSWEYSSRCCKVNGCWCCSLSCVAAIGNWGWDVDLENARGPVSSNTWSHAGLRCPESRSCSCNCCSRWLDSRSVTFGGASGMCLSARKG